jgi:hypothetical protein
MMVLPDRQQLDLATALGEARGRVRRARRAAERALTAPARRRAAWLLAEREAQLLGLVARSLAQRATAPPTGGARDVPADSAGHSAARPGPPATTIPQRAPLDRRARRLIARSQFVVAVAIAARQGYDPWAGRPHIPSPDTAAADNGALTTE